MTGIRGIRCTPKEELALARAIQQRLLQKFTPALSVVELQRLTNFNVYTSIVYLAQRVKEVSFQVTQALEQIGSSPAVIDENIDAVCVGLGVRTPRDIVGDMTPYTDKFPEQVGVAHALSLLHIYIEVAGNLNLGILSPSREESRSAFRAAIGPYLSRLHKEGSLLTTVAIINSALPVSLMLAPPTAGDRYTGALCNSIFTAFETQYEALATSLSGRARLATTMEVKTHEEYKTRSTLIVRNFQFFLRYHIYTKRHVMEWDEWFLTVYNYLRQLDEDGSTFGFEHEEGLLSETLYDFVVLVVTFGKVWEASRLSEDEVEDLIRSGEPLPLVRVGNTLQAVQIPMGSDILRNEETLSRLIQNMCVAQTSMDQLEYLLPTLLDVVYAQYHKAVSDSDHPVSAIISHFFEINNHYILRQLYHTTEAVAMQVLDDGDPQVLEAEHMIEVVMTSKSRFNLTSPASILRTSRQIPNSTSCEEEVMQEFLARWTTELRELDRCSFESRSVGLLSTVEVNQYAIQHAVYYCRTLPGSDDKPVATYVLGNHSGFWTKMAMAHWKHDKIVHLSHDVRMLRGSQLPVLGETSSSTPPELSLVGMSETEAQRLVIEHGLFGDLASWSVYRSRKIAAIMTTHKARVLLLDMTSIDPSNQDAVIKNIITQFISTKQGNAPIVALWHCGSLSVKAFLRLVSTTNTCKFEVVGPEYCASPILISTIQPISNSALKATDFRLPLSFRTGLEVITREARDIGVGASENAFRSNLEDLVSQSCFRVSAVLPLPSVLSYVKDTCVCKLEDAIRSCLTETLSLGILSHAEKFIKGGLPDAECQANLRLIGDLFTYLGVEAALRHSTVFDLVGALFDKFQESVTALIPHLLDAMPEFVVGEQTVRFERLTAQDHALSMSEGACLLHYKNHAVDLLYRYNTGLAKAFDIRMCLTHVLIQPPTRLHDKTKVMSTLYENLTLKPCCMQIAPDQAQATLLHLKTQLAIWIQGGLKNRLWNQRHQRAPRNPEFASPEYAERREESPVYMPESPTWNGKKTTVYESYILI